MLNTAPRTYGFDPDVEYVIRSRWRDYQGVTERFRFANGQTIAARMRADATAEQIEARCERLARIRDVRKLTVDDDGAPKGEVPTYAIYVRGTEPAPQAEPLWRGQDPPEGQEDVDTGEEDGAADVDESVRSMRSRESTQVDEATARVFPSDTGEDVTEPEQTLGDGLARDRGPGHEWRA